MNRHRRIYVPWGRYFFTVNIAHRGADVLVRHIEVLRHAVRVTRLARHEHYYLVPINNNVFSLEVF
ncbi:transposase [Sulfitobacter mediterraneus]|uniref:Transposase n=1 Tax=Sulfitobacter mediterraneus TaxID=83219 RepID=A0A061STE1_9RHOB|nr:transposase [Sulfitobacter mediterraneus]